MQHSPARTAIISAIITAVIFGVGWVIIINLDTSIQRLYPAFIVATLVAVAWAGWSGYKVGTKRIAAGE
jgi:hypothetical protein